MGIGGSGMAVVAEIARAYGFDVSGCDLKTGGHDVSHLEGIDILAVTPAVYFQSAQHPELVEGNRRGITMTWQEFMGKYLHKDKFVICVAGTHGKSTTTAMVGKLLETAKLDPTVELGASGSRVGKSNYFVSEADEYYENFLHYHPDIVILNNIEMDHPEYFKTMDKLLATYQKFIDQIKPGGTLIYNTDNANIHKLTLPGNAIAYSGKDFPADIVLKIPGDHNKTNAMGVIKLAELLKIDYKEALENFTGIDRRLELLGEKNGIKVYDDYANLPTAFAANLQALKEVNPDSKIWAIIEPHTFSRLRAVLDELKPSLKLADHIIISKVFASRETDPGDFSGADIAAAAEGEYIAEFADIVKKVSTEVKSGDTILVMGSGESYKLARDLTAALN